MTIKRRHLLTLLALPPASVQAAAWPTRPIRLIVVYPPGGISDLVARALAAKLSTRLGQAVLIDYRPGAGGSTGMEELARAKPDGYSLAFSAITPLSLTPLLRRVSYDAQRDFSMLAAVMHTPLLLVATPAFGGHDLAAVLRAARANPGALRWASSGLGTTGHLVLEQMQLASGAVFTHIPYKGGGQQLNDALSGQFELLSTNLGPLQLQYIRSGHFKPLALGAPARLASLAGTPTFAELGFEAANLASLFGIFGPAGLSIDIAQRLNHEINHALAAPDLQAQLLAADNLPAAASMAEFRGQIESAIAQNRRLLLAGRIRAE